MALEFIKPTYSPVKSVNGQTGDVVIEIPEVDMTGVATEEYVNKKIAEAELGGGEGGTVSLDNYYTKSEVDALIPEVPSLEPYALKEEIPDVSGFATKEEIPDVSGFATKEEIPAMPDLDAYALKSDIPDVSGYQTEEQVQAAITVALGNIGVAEEGEY